MLCTSRSITLRIGTLHTGVYTSLTVEISFFPSSQNEIIHRNKLKEVISIQILHVTSESAWNQRRSRHTGEEGDRRHDSEQYANTFTVSINMHRSERVGLLRYIELITTHCFNTRKIRCGKLLAA